MPTRTVTNSGSTNEATRLTNTEGRATRTPFFLFAACPLASAMRKSKERRQAVSKIQTTEVCHYDYNKFT
jgi:hypothetical protein